MILNSFTASKLYISLWNDRKDSPRLSEDLKCISYIYLSPLPSSCLVGIIFNLMTSKCKNFKISRNLIADAIKILLTSLKFPQSLSAPKFGK